jgi:PilZ domain-containing protein
MAPKSSDPSDETEGSRAIRINTHRVRLGRTDGVLLNLSATGALVRVPTRLAVDTDVSFAISADDRPVNLRCRVVRCTETPVNLPGATWRHTEFDTAVVFDPHSEALGTFFEMMYRQSRPAQEQARE